MCLYLTFWLKLKKVLRCEDVRGGAHVVLGFLWPGPTGEACSVLTKGREHYFLKKIFLDIGISILFDGLCKYFDVQRQSADSLPLIFFRHPAWLFWVLFEFPSFSVQKPCHVAMRKVAATMGTLAMHFGRCPGV